MNLPAENIRKIFDDFTRLRVLIIGDVMVDAYIWGKVNRISPEAPVPIVSVEKKENRLGGAANVALNIQALGAIPVLCSVIGTDKPGDIFIDLLNKQELEKDGILRSRERPTTKKSRVIGNNHQMLRVDDETEVPLTQKECDDLINKIKRIIAERKPDVIIFEDYDKGIINAELIEKIVEEARKNNIPVAVDPKKKNFKSYKKVTLFKPNLKELKEGLKLDIENNDLQEIEVAVAELRKNQELENVLLTLSEKGVYIQNDSVKRLVPAHIRNIADVSGAGDTVISVAALCLALNLEPYVIASLSNLAGGLVCEKVGVVPVNKEQLLNEALNS